MKKKILVTGGAGFIGGYIVDMIIKSGNEPYIYDLVDGNDIRDKRKLDVLFDTENFDAVINLSALAGVRRGEAFPEEYFSTNLEGLLNVVRASEKYGVERFIHYSSSSVFGVQQKGRPAKEEDEKSPQSIYGITKLAGEHIVSRSSLNYTIIRPFTVVGEHGRKDMVVYKWLERIRSGLPIIVFDSKMSGGTGPSERGYTPVGDIADATMTALQSEGAVRQTFNIGGKDVLTIEDLLEIFLEEYPDTKVIRKPMEKIEQETSVADYSKATKLLGWTPKADTRELIRQIIRA